MRAACCADLSSPGREVLEGPPDFVVLGRLLDLLADFHDGREAVVGVGGGMCVDGGIRVLEYFIEVIEPLLRRF